jgi:hypothetical protein
MWSRNNCVLPEAALAARNNAVASQAITRLMHVPKCTRSGFILGMQARLQDALADPTLLDCVSDKRTVALP